ncbi:hypothetical protein [Brucella pituitosa]|uniref:DUF551 domain-containing protein n=1 Tax=Brucella pituitosa TaxID=571256 RepID=A0ABS3K0N9_9HYPH|nr:hypothetical protein [Brucella pituitosa]MBO1040459.1 hypothetical protein [Brucella pituitosa]
MLVNEQAVNAMQAYLRRKRYVLPSGIAREALAAALPFLQGVNDAWANTDNAPKDGTRLILLWKPFGGISEHIELGRWSSDKGVWVNTYGHAFSSPPDAWTPLAPYKAPSPRDYRDCVCTKIHQDEDCLIGYPSLLCEICDGKGVVPSPRAQALEEDVLDSAKFLLCAFDPEKDLDNPEKFLAWHNLDDAIRALSYHPAEDGWSKALPEYNRHPHYVLNIDGIWHLKLYRGNGVLNTISVHETAEAAMTAAPLPASPGASE